MRGNVSVFVNRVPEGEIVNAMVHGVEKMYWLYWHLRAFCQPQWYSTTIYDLWQYIHQWLWYNAPEIPCSMCLYMIKSSVLYYSQVYKINVSFVQYMTSDLTRFKFFHESTDYMRCKFRKSYYCHLPNDTSAHISVSTSVKAKSSSLDNVFQTDHKSHSIRHSWERCWKLARA